MSTGANCRGHSRQLRKVRKKKKKFVHTSRAFGTLPTLFVQQYWALTISRKQKKEELVKKAIKSLVSPLWMHRSKMRCNRLRCVWSNAMAPFMTQFQAEPHTRFHTSTNNRNRSLIQIFCSLKGKEKEGTVGDYIVFPKTFI